MIDLPTLQAIAAMGAMLMLIVALFYWMLHNTERNIREEWNNSIRNFRADMLDQMNGRMDRLTDQMNGRMDRLSDRMDHLSDRMHQLDGRMDQLSDQMDRNHREILALLENHTHADGTPAVFHRVTGSADG